MSVVNEERNYTVYMHACKKTKKVYVGITCQIPEDRWGKNGNGYKGQYFYNIIQKYGWDNFEHIILFENKTKEEAEKLEILYIKVLMSNNKNFGYNIANGGNSNGKHSEETKDKISNTKKGKGIGRDSPVAKRVYCNNISFESVTECANFFNVDAKNMRRWLNGTRKMPKKFFDLNLHYLDLKIEIKFYDEKIIICNEIKYNSLTECAKFYNINHSLLWMYLNGKVGMPQKFIDLNLHYIDKKEIIKPRNNFKGKSNPNSKNVICNNAIYNCVRECAEYYNIKRGTMSQWLIGSRKMPKKYTDLGLRYYNSEVDGDIEQYEQYIAS